MAEVHFVSSCVCEWYYKYKQEDTLLLQIIEVSPLYIDYHLLKTQNSGLACYAEKISGIIGVCPIDTPVLLTKITGGAQVNPPTSTFLKYDRKLNSSLVVTSKS
jgi:hypothetical protein